MQLDVRARQSSRDRHRRHIRRDSNGRLDAGIVRLARSLQLRHNLLFNSLLPSYAPWCPACKQFSQTWESLAEWAVERGNGVRVGKVDVTAESGGCDCVLNTRK